MHKILVIEDDVVSVDWEGNDSMLGLKEDKDGGKGTSNEDTLWLELICVLIRISCSSETIASK